MLVRFPYYASATFHTMTKQTEKIYTGVTVFVCGLYFRQRVYNNNNNILLHRASTSQDKHVNKLNNYRTDVVKSSTGPEQI